MLGQPLDGGVEAVLVVVEQRGQPVELVDRAGQRRAAPGRAGPPATWSRCRATRWPCRSGRGRADSPLTSCSSWSIAPENSSPSLDRVSSTVSQIVDQLLDDLVVVGQRVRERRRLREQRFQRAALALQDLDQRAGQRVDILRIQALDNGFQPAEQQVEVQRGRGAVHRDLRARAAGSSSIRGASTSSR